MSGGEYAGEQKIEGEREERHLFQILLLVLFLFYLQL